MAQDLHPSRRRLLLATASLSATAAAISLPAVAGEPAGVPAGASSRKLAVNGTTLHVVVAGSGSPVLLVHGWPETWYAWRKVIPVLAERHTVIAPDMRGFGDSDRPKSGYDKLTVAADLRALVRALGFSGIDLVAQDMGAPVGFAYAAMWPNEVRTFTFIESAIPGFGLEPLMDVAHGGSWHMGFCMTQGINDILVAGRERTFIEYFYRRGTMNPSALTDRDIDEYARTFAAGGLAASFNYYRTLLEDAKTNVARFSAAKLPMPVLSLAAAHGLGAISHRSIGQVAARVHERTISDARHFLVQDQPAAAAAEIANFIA